MRFQMQCYCSSILQHSTTANTSEWCLTPHAFRLTAFTHSNTTFTQNTTCTILQPTALSLEILISIKSEPKLGKIQ